MKIEKIILYLNIVVFLGMPCLLHAAGDDILSDPTIISSPISSVFVPQGFDSNDNAEIIISGKFQSNCNSIAPPIVQVDKVNKIITIQVRANLLALPHCFDFPSPYTQIITLGILPEGDYKVVVRDYFLPVLNMPVNNSHNDNQDDNFYAPVAIVRVDLDSHMLALEGNFPNSCIQMKEVKVIPEKGNIITILPIAEFKDSSNCYETEKYFTYTQKLPGELRGTYLIYVRKTHGQSLTQVEKFR